MTLRLLLGTLPLLSLVGGLAASPSVVRATEIWSGRTFAFSKAPHADPTLAVNQDRITPLVWITRAETQGLYNAQSEAFYTSAESPAGTEWATGNAVDHSSLTFLPWENWAESYPPGTVGVNAVVHLIAEDIYLDIVFNSWGVGVPGGGGFAYHRAPNPATPANASTWGRIKTLYR